MAAAQACGLGGGGLGVFWKEAAQCDPLAAGGEVSFHDAQFAEGGQGVGGAAILGPCVRDHATALKACEEGVSGAVADLVQAADVQHIVVARKRMQQANVRGHAVELPPAVQSGEQGSPPKGERGLEVFQSVQGFCSVQEHLLELIVNAEALGTDFDRAGEVATSLTLACPFPVTDHFEQLK